MAADLTSLQSVLPSFPVEVLEEWLLPYAESEGWPPAQSGSAPLMGRWRFLLRDKPLDYWKSIKWQSVERHVSIYDLHPEYQHIMTQMILGAVEGQTNLYSATIKNLAARFNRVKDHFADNGTFPKPPTLLAEALGLAILDGNHRMAAYIYCFGSTKLTVDAELRRKTKSLQRYWVGSP